MFREIIEKVIEGYKASSKLTKITWIALASGYVVTLALIACMVLTPSKPIVAFSLEVPAKQHQQAIFMVKPFTPERQSIKSGGTGFLVQPSTGGEPIIVTNAHVCRMDPSKNYILLEQGLSVYAARIIAISLVTDLCVIQPPPEVVEQRRPYRLAKSEPTPGEKVTVYGHPFLRPLTKSSGNYIAVSREPVDISDERMGFDATHILRVARTDFMVFPGNSGSPVLNSSEEVVGVIFAYEGHDHVGLFIPLMDLIDFIARKE